MKHQEASGAELGVDDDEYWAEAVRFQAQAEAQEARRQQVCPEREWPCDAAL